MVLLKTSEGFTLLFMGVFLWVFEVINCMTTKSNL